MPNRKETSFRYQWKSYCSRSVRCCWAQVQLVYVCFSVCRVYCAVLCCLNKMRQMFISEIVSWIFSSSLPQMNARIHRKTKMENKMWIRSLSKYKHTDIIYNLISMICSACFVGGGRNELLVFMCWKLRSRIFDPFLHVIHWWTMENFSFQIIPNCLI